MVVAFQNEDGADQALKDLKQAKKDKLIRIDNAAVLRKDEKGKIHIRETAQIGGGKGAALGGVVGAGIGVLAGPVLVVPVAVGALIGGLAAKMRDSGFDDSRLAYVGQNLEPGTSAIIAVVEHRWVDELERELEEEAADMFTIALSEDIASQLEAGHEVAYSALSAQGAFVGERVAVGEDFAEGGKIIATDEAVVGQRYVATPEGIAVQRVLSTDEYTATEVAAATDTEAAYGAAIATDAGVVAGAIDVSIEDEAEGKSEDDEA
jgi:uncharacterized membrane protein